MSSSLRSFKDVVRELSEKYSVPIEIVESIICDWVELLHDTVSPTRDSDLSDFWR